MVSGSKRLHAVTIVDRHFQAVGGSPIGKGLYDEDYITKVYTLQGCVDIPGGQCPNYSKVTTIKDCL